MKLLSVCLNFLISSRPRRPPPPRPKTSTSVSISRSVHKSSVTYHKPKTSTSTTTTTTTTTAPPTTTSTSTTTTQSTTSTPLSTTGTTAKYLIYLKTYSEIQHLKWPVMYSHHDLLDVDKFSPSHVLYIGWRPLRPHLP